MLDSDCFLRIVDQRSISRFNVHFGCAAHTLSDPVRNAGNALFHERPQISIGRTQCTAHANLIANDI